MGGALSCDDWNVDYAEVVAEAGSDEYAGVDQEQLEDLSARILESVSPVEAFCPTEALAQLGPGAGTIASDPAFAQVAVTALPQADGGLGTAEVD